MTDNRTTELMKLLDERGEHYVYDGHCVTWSYYSDPHTATESMDGTLIVTGLTPEQAIAATLGNGTLIAEQVREAAHGHYELCMVRDVEYETKMDALLCRLTNGKWSKSRAYDLDFMVSCIEEEYETLHAKELAELGSGTCEMTRVKEFPEYEDCIFECWTCSACGRSNNEHNPKFCPNCGKRIRKAVER